MYSCVHPARGMTVDVFFFFKQNTAYEMRISYWSSDVCSSDLPGSRASARNARRCATGSACSTCRDSRASTFRRTEERRVGKEGVRQCRSRRSPDPKKKQNESDNSRTNYQYQPDNNTHLPSNSLSLKTIILTSTKSLKCY